MIFGTIKELQRYAGIFPRLETYTEFLKTVDDKALGRYELTEGDYALVQAGETRPIEGSDFEFHHDHADIQVILEGQEYMKWQDLVKLDIGDYDADKDFGEAKGDGELICIKAGMFYSVFPEDAHMPSLHVDHPNAFAKVVFKVKL